MVTSDMILATFHTRNRILNRPPSFELSASVNVFLFIENSRCETDVRTPCILLNSLTIFFRCIQKNRTMSAYSMKSSGSNNKISWTEILVSRR